MPALPEAGEAGGASARPNRSASALALHALLALATGVVLLAAAAEVSHRYSGVEYQSITSEKLGYVREHADEIDVYFVGSSRVLRGIDPIVVDERRHELGCKGGTSFNFGRGGMTAPTAAAIVAAIEEESAGRAPLILVEPFPAYGPAMLRPSDPASRFANRPSTFWLGLLQVWTMRPPNDVRKDVLPAWLLETPLHTIGVERLFVSLRYVKTFGTATLGIGAAQRALVSNRGERVEPVAAHVLQRRGFQSLDTRLAEASGDEARGLEIRRNRNRQGLAAGLAALVRPRDAIARELTSLEARYVRSFLAAMVRAGTRIGIVFTPTTYPETQERNDAAAAFLRDQYPDISVLALEPSAAPALFVPHFWFDSGHLTEAGARVYSRGIGAALCRAPDRARARS